VPGIRLMASATMGAPIKVTGRTDPRIRRDGAERRLMGGRREVCDDTPNRNVVSS